MSAPFSFLFCLFICPYLISALIYSAVCASVDGVCRPQELQQHTSLCLFPLVLLEELGRHVERESNNREEAPDNLPKSYRPQKTIQGELYRLLLLLGHLKVITCVRPSHATAVDRPQAYTLLHFAATAGNM